MTTQVFILGLLYMLTLFDNVILSAVFLPNGDRSEDVALFAGCALPLFQVVLMMWAEQVLKVQAVLLCASVLMAWASIQTLLAVSWNRGAMAAWRVSLRVLLWTLLGNMDDVVWVGDKLNGHYAWLVFFAVATIPLYLVLTMSLAEVCRRFRFILVGEAVLTAWAGTEMFMHTTIGSRLFGVGSQIQATVQICLTVVVISIGFIWLALRQRRIGLNTRY